MAASGLFWLYRTERVVLAPVCAVAFLLALLDGSLSLHEALGAEIGRSLLAGAGEMKTAIGEMIVFAVYGLVFLAGLAVAWARSDPEGRRVARDLIIVCV